MLIRSDRPARNTGTSAVIREIKKATVMLILVLVLKDSLRTKMKSLSLSWSLEKSPCKGPCSSVFKQNFALTPLWIYQQNYTFSCFQIFGLLFSIPPSYRWQPCGSSTLSFGGHTRDQEGNALTVGWPLRSHINKWYTTSQWSHLYSL